MQQPTPALQPLKPLLLLLSVIFFLASSAQKKSVEVSVLGRYDQHADYVSNFAGRVYDDSYRLYGKSYGINIGYRKQVRRTLFTSISIGYYKLGIDKIEGASHFSTAGTRTSRSINNSDDDSTKLLYSTSKYHYNNIALTFGLSKVFSLNTLQLEAGVEGMGYYNFSQRYRLMNNYNYSTRNPKPLEFGVNATLGVLKEYDKFYIRPALIIPVYQNLKGDKAFTENRDLNIPKWFNGIGAVIRVGKYL
jgi:hypothetical protein